MDDVLGARGGPGGRTKPGEWVRGRGWDEGKLAERRHITAADLDEVAPNNPVWLTNTTGHYGVGNSYAMKIAELRKGTPDPAGRHHRAQGRRRAERRGARDRRCSSSPGMCPP